ncbi:MAG: AsmA-like C-terminal region-containing protein [Rhodospirillales bacterium]|nr:AsmA-like C-terminal region-containing protein [Rhodospirillales bacterium]
MLKRSLHHLFYLLTGLVVAAVFAGALVAWRLGQGPLSLNWAVPTLEHVVNGAGSPLSFTIGDVILTWQGWESGLDVRFLNVGVRSEDDRPIAAAPEMSVALSTDALRSFRLAPTAIHLYAPRLRLVRREDGTLEVALAETEGAGTPFREVLKRALTSPNDASDPLSFLQVVSISDGSFVYRDRQLKATWRGRLQEARLVRGEDSMTLNAALSLLAGGDAAAATVDAAFTGSTGVIEARTRFSGLRPASLAAVNPALSQLLAVDLPLSGAASFTTGADGSLEAAEFDVNGGSGRLSLTPEIAASIGEPAAVQDLAVDELALAGRYEGNPASISIESSGIAFAEGTQVRLPKPTEQSFPIASIAGQARYDIAGDALSLTTLDLDLGGPKLSVEGQASGVSGPEVAGEATLFISRVAVDELATYWPSFVAPGGRKWVLGHLSRGMASQGEVKLGFGPTQKGIDVTRLDGSLDVAGVSVDYRPPAPPVRNAAASVQFDLDSLTVRIGGGETQGLTITGGSARILEARAKPPRLDLDVRVEGTVPAALTLLAAEPFGYTKKLGFSPRDTQGNVAAELNLKLPLIDDPDLGQIKLAVGADVTNLFIAGAFLGGDVTGGSLRLDVSEKGMDIVGPAAFEGVDCRLAWRENFAPRAPFVRSIDVSFPSLRLQALRRLKPDIIAMLETWVDGPLAGAASVTFKNERDIDFDADIDVTDASLRFPPIGWSKERNRRGFIFLAGRFAGDRLAEISRASISAPNLEALGSVGLAGDGSLRRVIIDRLISGRTDASAIVTTAPDAGWDISVGGNGLDLHPFMQLGEGDDDPATGKGSSQVFDSFTLSADLDRLWLKPEAAIRAVTATVVREDGVFSLAQVAGSVGRDPISVDIAPAGPQRRTLAIQAEDAGEALRALGIFPDINGGRLTVKGTFDDTPQGRGALDGTLKIRGFRVIRAPIIAQILNIMALSGILDVLRGGGISFTALDAPFVLRDDVLFLNQARMHGNAIGLTAEGTYRLERDLLDVRGTLVPFYVVNSLLGNLPLVGALFSGGERGGGLFAASYSVSGPMSKPDISVNPVSVLAPGVLRNLFRIFETSPTDEDLAAPVRRRGSR